MPTALATPARKHTKLVRGAAELLHEQGFQRTTLADVATRADVPLGNVYYHFKTKEALAEAVISAHEEALHEYAAWEAKHRDPAVRLRCLVPAPLDSESIIQFGCPHGSLCQELEKLGAEAPLAKAGARLLTVYLDWASEQFSACGLRPSEARGRAMDLVASLEGTLLLAHTFRSRNVLSRQLGRVEAWLDAQLSPSPRSRK